MVEAQNLALQLFEIAVAGRDLAHEADIRFPQPLHEDQLAQILQQPGDEGFVARHPPERFTDLARRDRLDQGVLPIVFEDFSGDLAKQAIGQAEAQHEQFQRLDAQECQRLIQI